MTTASPSARPAWAVYMWADDSAIYLEIPAKDGPPYVEKYYLSEAGLSKALYLMRSAHRAAQPNGGQYKIILQAQPKLPPHKDFTPEQRRRASEILKDLLAKPKVA